MAEDFRYPEDRFLLVGKVAKPHGLRGEVKIYAFSDEAETLLHYRRAVLVDGQGRLSAEQIIEKARLQGKMVVIKLASITCRNEAEALHGMGMLVFKEDLPAIAKNEFFWYQFIDLPVCTEDGMQLGTIRSIFSNGAQDIMVVGDGTNEYLVPILGDIIRKQTEKGVVIAPPPGLLEMNTGSNE